MVNRKTSYVKNLAESCEILDILYDAYRNIFPFVCVFIYAESDVSST